MNIMIGIHNGAEGWIGGWIEYCESNGIPYKLVNCFDSDIIPQIRPLDGLLWHINNWVAADLLIANHILTSAEEMGLEVFPNQATRWHFDDKAAQKYLLEAVQAPCVPTYLFYDEDAALAWLRTTDYPVVAKLRRGFASYNIRLLHSYREARAHCHQMFGRGINPVPGYLSDIRTKIRKGRALGNWRGVFQRAMTYWRVLHKSRGSFLPERGYVLFQKYLPHNTYDTRIAVVGDRAWGFTRDTRPGDFRASGSGLINYDRDRIDPECVRRAFALARTLRSQSMGFDFLRAPDGELLICEICYAYSSPAIYACEGFWDPQLDWHPGHLKPEQVILQNLCDTIRKRKEQLP